MFDASDVLWLNASPSLQRFDRPLLRALSKTINVSQWEYYQSQDEASSVLEAVSLLHQYLQMRDRPIHLAGHGISGVVALLYARLHPEKVRSLSLLAVAAQPALTWHAHYYIQRQTFPCSRIQLLAQTARSLFGTPLPHAAKNLVEVLGRDLESSPNLHSLFKVACLAKESVTMPLLVCGSKSDPIVDPHTFSEWLPLLKPEDDIWQCPDGHHFFHYYCPQLVGEQLLNFWQPAYSNSLANQGSNADSQQAFVE